MRHFILRLRVWLLRCRITGIELNESLGQQEIAEATQKMRTQLKELTQ